MGFFDILKNIRKNKPKREKQTQEKINYKITISCTQSGNLKVELYEINANESQKYDTTVMIIESAVKNLDGYYVQEASVCWYRKEKEQFILPEYTTILMNIDMNLIFEDETYAIFLMKELLNKVRVNSYLNNGLQDETDKPSGKYIGAIEKTKDGYRKIFYTDIGEASHNSPEMREKRKEYKGYRGGTIRVNWDDINKTKQLPRNEDEPR